MMLDRVLRPVQLSLVNRLFYLKNERSVTQCVNRHLDRIEVAFEQAPDSAYIPISYKRFATTIESTPFSSGGAKTPSIPGVKHGVATMPGIGKVDTVIQNGVELTVCEAHKLEECHRCCLSFTAMNDEARFHHTGSKHCDFPSCNSIENLKRCGGCNNAWYCNRECQRSHWNVHKTVCRATGSLIAVRKGEPPVRRLKPGAKVICIDRSGRNPPNHAECEVIRFLPGRGPYTDPLVPIDLQKYPQYLSDENYCRYSLKFPSGDIFFEECSAVHDEHCYNIL